MNDIDGDKTNSSVNQPELSRANLADLSQVRVMDENGEFRDAEITGERPLTIYVDKNEIVTLMTLGSHPELLTLGYLFNQRFINDLNEVRSVQVDWEVDASVVNTWKGIEGLEERLGRRTVTTGCGQGTVYGSSFTGYSNVSKITIRFTENQGLSMDAPSADRTRSSYSLRMSDGTTPWTPLPERCCWMECQVKTKFSIPPDVLPLKWCSKWRKWESPS